MAITFRYIKMDCALARCKTLQHYDYSNISFINIFTSVQDNHRRRRACENEIRCNYTDQ